MASAENQLIAACAQSREAYDTLSVWVQKDDLSDFINVIWKEVVSYYERDKNADKIEWGLISPRLVQTFPKREELITEYITNLPAHVSVPNLRALYASVKKEALAYKIVQSVATEKEIETRALMEEYLNLQLNESEGEEIYNGKTLDELEHKLAGDLIPVYPIQLNTSLGGGLPKQSQIILFGRPNVGKTAFTINFGYGAASNGRKVLHLVNEESTDMVNYRILSRFTKRGIGEMLNSRTESYDLATSKGYLNVFLKGLSPTTLREIEALVKKLEPDVVILDQVRNMDLNKDSLTITLEQAAIGMRSLAKRYGFLSFLVTQAGNSASHKAFLHMEDVDSSKTGIQGACDVMIGIGQDDQLRNAGCVMINVPKTKYTADIPAFSAKIDYMRNFIST